MSHTLLPTRTLPDHRGLAQLRRQAKELLAAYRGGVPAAIAEVSSLYRDADPETFALHDAQLVLARAYGYASWPRLKAFVEGATDQRLVDAVRRGDLEEATRMLGVRPDLAAHPGALHAAVLTRAPALVRLLLRHGARARAGVYPHADATTPLTLATERGYDEIVDINSDAERRVSAATDGSAGGGGGALFEALRAGNDELAISLMTREPALVAATLPGLPYRPLQAAAGSLRPDLAAWLLDHGADASGGAAGRTPLDLAARRSHPSQDRPEVRARFLQIVGRLRGRGAPMTACAAAALGDVAWLRARHAEGALINPIEDDGGLLSIAVRHQQPGVLDLLLELGFDPDERTRWAEEDGDRLEFTSGMPLVQCAFLHRPALAERLLEGGADPNAMVAATGTPVYIAWMQHDQPMIALLERYGGAPDLTVAAYSRRPDLARRLVEAADDSVAAGEELIGPAACGGDPEVLKLALERATWPRDDERWFGVLEQPLRVWNHASPNRGRPGWDRASYRTCFAMILQRCDPNLRGRVTNNRTPLGLTMLHHVAGARSRVTDEECVAFATMLLDAGARLDVRDRMLESTPLGWACRWGRAPLAALFLDRGADPVEADAPAWARPASWARAKGHEAILDLLRRRSVPGRGPGLVGGASPEA